MTTVTVLSILVGSSLLAAALVCVELLRRRAANYRDAIAYDVRADQHLGCNRDICTQHTLVPEQGGFTWPVLDGTWSCALLDLKVSSRTLGHVVDPKLETRLGSKSACHYFERGASGRRVLNVTSLLEGGRVAGGKLAVHGEQLDWQQEGATLHLLRTAAAPPGPMLVLAPHPDDAEIAAFGLIAGHPQAWVATVTLGDNGPSKYGEFLPREQDAYEEKARIRAWDSMTIPQMAGVAPERLANLGYFDGTLAQLFAAPDAVVPAVFTADTDITKFRCNPLDPQQLAARASNWKNLVADFEQLLAHIRPTTVVTPHPQLDPHGDHQFTTIALIEAMHRVGLAEGQLLLYANHALGTELYPFGERDGAISVPPHHGAAPFYESIVSVPLDPRTRLRKQIAIEAQHDLRTAPQSRRPSVSSVVVAALKMPYRFIVEPDNDYVRRAARDNELFFTVSYARAAQLRDAFLQGRPAPAPRSGP